MVPSTSSRERARESRVSNVDGQLVLTGRDRGFTVIELLVVMAIIGLLAAIAIPLFVKVKKNAYDSAAVSDLRQMIIQNESQYAQIGAYASYGPHGPPWVYPGDPILANVILTNPEVILGGTNAGEYILYWPNTFVGMSGGQYGRHGTDYKLGIYDTRTFTLFCANNTSGGGIQTVPSQTASAAFNAFSSC